VGEEKFKVGDLLVLKRPDGVRDLARIGGLEFLNPSGAGEECQLVITLSEKAKRTFQSGRKCVGRQL
jgi:hypothetical protein